MKIKGKYKSADFTKCEGMVEIDISAEELASQLSFQELYDLDSAIKEQLEVLVHALTKAPPELQCTCDIENSDDEGFMGVTNKQGCPKHNPKEPIPPKSGEIDKPTCEHSWGLRDANYEGTAIVYRMCSKCGLTTTEFDKPTCEPEGGDRGVGYKRIR